MPNNPFGSSVDAPKPDQNLGRLAGQVEGLANEAASIGRDQLEWQKLIDDTRLGKITPVVDQQIGLGSDSLGRARDFRSRYDTSYQPLENLQLYDSLGSGWLSTDAQGGLVDANLSQRLQTLQAQLKAGKISQADYDAQVAALNRGADYEKTMLGASKAAEDAVAGLATADATQAEGRFIAGLGMEAGRMGVDPSRVLASAGARAPSAAAAAVHGGNTARFGFRDARSKNLADTVQSGRQVAQLANNEASLGLSAGNAGVGNLNSTVNSMTAARTAPAAWFGTGMQGLNSAAGLLNQQYNQQRDAYAAETERDSGFLDLLGTATAAGLKYGLISKRHLKKNKRPADTEETLEAIKNMDTDRWDYKPGVEDGGTHVGPYADEMAELGLSDGHKVNPMDTAGLALAGVKQLAKKVERIEAGLEPLSASRAKGRRSSPEHDVGLDTVGPAVKGRHGEDHQVGLSSARDRDTRGNASW